MSTQRERTMLQKFLTVNALFAGVLGAIIGLGFGLVFLEVAQFTPALLGFVIGGCIVAYRNDK